ncbi:sensor histidine kinase [Natronolimnohabitans innermongolicus]|uniref:histidine kinase n=1 Tax=Natronolimnohabitans innermongolicus JCM 12255 TaxID=1227499 RepID=L9WMJ9_9EURY|nr:sensor histidine kinase [Natronolimnohabitans innermongolicus]ELY49543.1 ATP-binding region ATPase domain-containing protein [Natronolimnohabitans innermongolicus JCM 12255]
MRLVYRFGIAFLVVVVVTGGVLTVTFDTHRSGVEQTTDEAIADRAELSASILDDRLEEQQRTVEVAATNAELRGHGTDEQDAALESFVAAGTFDGATVVSENGTVRSYATSDDATDGGDLVETELGDRPYVDRALEGESSVSDPLSARTGNTIVAFSVPLFDDGEVVGALNAAYHLEETDFFDAIDRGTEHDAVTVTAGGETVYTSAAAFDDSTTQNATLETTGWMVTAHRDRAVIDEQLNRLIVFQAGAGLAVLGVIAAFGTWIYRSKIRRIGRVTERVQALERREYDGGPSVDGPAEWQRIEDTLDRLATALSRREQMLLVLNRILRHNLRNTLNVVAGRASNLEGRLDDENRDAAREIRLATDELLDLADRARMTETLLEPVDESETTPRTDLASVVRDRTAAFVREQTDDDSAPDVTVETPERAVAACGDEVAAAVDELLENTVDHAGPAPTVAVAVETTDERVRIRITDDGSGIPTDEAAVVTGTQAISQVTHTGGIGLWLVDWIATRYGGRLLIPPPRPDDGSDSEDRGATVVLEFPIADHDADGATDPDDASGADDVGD